MIATARKARRPARKQLPSLTMRVERLEKELLFPQPKVSTLSLPKIGSAIAGGIFAGILAGKDGAEDYALIIGCDLDRAAWSAQLSAAKACKDEGFTDWVVTDRRELRIAYANASNLFKAEWYWSSEQHAENSDCAWGQFFDDGYQYDWNKDGKGRARLVRRSPISQFIHSLVRAS